MSFLAPLYFLGALAIAGPILFHLIRRQPKGEVEFSSLMFLESTPPRLTRRNRLENWPLLLIRCAAICMLAFAFARPFLPLAQSENLSGVRQAVILLVDQSASMRRGDLWTDVEKKTDAILDQIDDETLISVIAFDDQPQQLLSLRESTALLPDARKGAAKDAIEKLKPSWRSTDIGKAIRYAADEAALLELDGAKDSSDESMGTTIDSLEAVIETRIVLISDLQSGADIQSLQGYQWPNQVWLDVQSIASKTHGNVSARVMPSAAGAAYEDSNLNRSNQVRVQILHSEDGNASTFQLQIDGSSQKPTMVQVPPGQSRIVSLQLESEPTADNATSNQDLPPEKESAYQTASVTISGDQDAFDNTFYFVRPRAIDQEILVIESPQKRRLEDQADEQNGDAQPRETLSFYVTQIPWSDNSRNLSVKVIEPGGFPDRLDANETPLVILTADDAPTDAQQSNQQDLLQQYLNSGGHLVVVLDRPATESMTSTLARLLESPELTIDDDQSDDYALISSVDFKSPLISPLSDPGVNDFSNIRVWRHRKITGLSDEINVILKLDDGSPLLVEKRIPPQDSDDPTGKLWVLSAGWQPSESQFALSTKFVPVMLGMLGPNHRVAPTSLIVGDKFDAADEEQATAPGFVQLDSGESVAVNLAAAESDTSVFDRDRLAEFGAVISTPQIRAQDKTAERSLRDVELEARQGWWQWLILATLALVAAETFLAAKNSPQTSEMAVSQ